MKNVFRSFHRLLGRLMGSIQLVDSLQFRGRWLSKLQTDRETKFTRLQ